MATKENINSARSGSLMLKHIGFQVVAGGFAGCVEVTQIIKI